MEYFTLYYIMTVYNYFCNVFLELNESLVNTEKILGIIRYKYFQEDAK